MTRRHVFISSVPGKMAFLFLIETRCLSSESNLGRGQINADKRVEFPKFSRR